MELPPEQLGTATFKKVMISSTALDLPEYRKEVMDACLRQGMFPIMMEHLPASDAEAIEASLKMVDEADIYLGVFAYRYGYIPKSHSVSITEMEYNRAIERDIPRLIFIMDKAHPIRIDDVEMGEGAVKLEALKMRLKTEQIINFFRSPADLRGYIINSLSYYRQPNLTAFHYVGHIPTPPEPYIAHPYTLLQTQTMIGRHAELNMLTDWVADPGTNVYRAHILNVVAIGGMGKSALTWKWFNDIAPHEIQPLAGRLWWSFYESDASFENFVIRVLAYLAGQPKEEIRKLPTSEREVQLLNILDREPYLLVLDGLERVLIAYARMDAARLADDDLNRRTANAVAGVLGLPESAAQSFTGQHRLRNTTDPRVGTFLRKLASVRTARILVSTRLYPAELQDKFTGDTIPGSFAYFLTGLKDDDALELWRTFGIGGTRDELLRLFRTFDNHPLLIRALAGEVKFYRHAPGNFERWRAKHKDFDPFHQPQVYEAMSHVLKFALQGLDETTREVLYTIAAFRMPAAYGTLTAVLIGDSKVLTNENALDRALSELEDRGLLGWDRRANRYDLHPIVRGVTWSGLDDQSKKGIYGTLHEHFKSLPMIGDWQTVKSLDDLIVPIELYNTLVGLEHYDDAFVVFHDYLSQATLFRLSAPLQRVELLEMLLTKEVDASPSLSRADDQLFTLNALALAYQFSGQPGRAVPLFRHHNFLCTKYNDQKSLCIGLRNLSDALRMSGSLYESRTIAIEALRIARRQKDPTQEAICLQWLGLIEAARGKIDNAQAAIQSSLRIFHKKGNKQWKGVSYDSLSEIALWLGEPTSARSLASSALELAETGKKYPINITRSRQRLGAAALHLDDLITAGKCLYEALVDARTANLVEEELQALIGLAELRRRQSDLKAARELLDDVWELAERGPYRLFHADAYNVLAQIERDAGDYAMAVRAATAAYRLAWCDGPPFAYHWGLQAAKLHFAALSISELSMPPFDEKSGTS